MLPNIHIAPRSGALPANGVADVFVDECESDLKRVAIPSTGVHVVARFGSHIAGGFDVHVLGPQYKVRRKWIRGGQSTVLARLPFGSCETVLGEPASELTGRIVAIHDLWDRAACQCLEQSLATAKDVHAAVNVLKTALADRLEPAIRFDTKTRLVQSAARRLESHNVSSVAADLGISERHLRRVFHEVTGLSPKLFFKLKRFERALEAAKDGRDVAWSDIAVGAGYYDQAHLIADFRAIAGATPREFLAEVS